MKRFELDRALAIQQGRSPVKLDLSKGDFISDLVNSPAESIEIIGWRSRDRVVISKFKFINYKRDYTRDSFPCRNVFSSRGNKVHLNQVTFKKSVFQDVDFCGGVPIDKCHFNSCTFTNCLFGEHIRWCNFSNCTFESCLFVGYLHESKFTYSCKFNNTLIHDLCYGNIYKILRDNCKSTNANAICEYHHFRKMN